jgi:hypothetical protein
VRDKHRSACVGGVAIAVTRYSLSIRAPDPHSAFDIKGSGEGLAGGNLNDIGDVLLQNRLVCVAEGATITELVFAIVAPHPNGAIIG